MESVSPDKSASGRRFTLLRTLGEGSFGIVHLAEMESAGGFKRVVALKLLHATFDPESDAGLRLRDEARLLGRLNHRNIVRVDDLVRLNGRWALVMEYVCGAGLGVLLEVAAESRSRLSPRAVAEAGAAVAAALVSAWTTPGENGAPLEVVHRDIKPSNIHLSTTGEIKVLDFGVARAAMSSREARTEAVRFGSLGYMAPERLLGEPEGPEGDIYALGVTLWELLTLGSYGRAVLGMDQQAAQVAAAHAALVEILGDAPPGSLLTDLVVRSLAYDPRERPTATEMAAGLRGVAATLPGQELVAFAQEFIPLVPEATARAGRGTILEETPTSPREINSDTLDVETLTDARALPRSPPDEPPSARPEPSPPGLPRWGLIGAGFLLASVGFVTFLVAAFLFLRSGDTTLLTPPSGTPPSEPPIAPLAAPSASPPPLPSPPTAPTAPTAPGAATPDVARVETSRVRPGRSSATPSEVELSPVAAPPQPATRPAVREAPSATASTAPVLRAAKFSLSGAEGMQVSCGAVTGTGATIVLLRDVPAGSCTVVVADRLRTTVTVDSPRGIACAVDGESLQCR